MTSFSDSRFISPTGWPVVVVVVTDVVLLPVTEVEHHWKELARSLARLGGVLARMVYCSHPGWPYSSILLFLFAGNEQLDQRAWPVI